MLIVYRHSSASGMTKYRGHCARCNAAKHKIRTARLIPHYITDDLVTYRKDENGEIVNNRICTSCYHILHQQHRVSQSSSLSQSSAACLSSLLSLSSSSPSSTNTIPIPARILRTALGDVTNIINNQSSPHRIQRKHSVSIGKKREIVRRVEEIKQQHDTTLVTALNDACIDGVDRQSFNRYKHIVDQRNNTSKKQRISLKRKRRRGGGRKPTLTAEQDQELKNWLMELRRGEGRIRVTVKDLRREAFKRYGSEKFKATAKWAKKWMKRMGLSLRLRTTGKKVTTEVMQKIEYRRSIQHIFIDSKRTKIKIYNCDEIAVYIDAPGNYTIDEIGVPTVEIGNTKHDKDRITVLLCVSEDGIKLPPLLIFKSKDKKKRDTVTATNIIYRDDDGNNKSMKMFFSYNPKAYINSRVFMNWINAIYHIETQQHKHKQHTSDKNSILFCDNCKAHDTPAVLSVMNDRKIDYQFFPPNTTPLLQPLDHSLNASFKRKYEEKWNKWYRNESHLHTTPKGNRQKASNETLAAWVAAAWDSITPEHIKKCWIHTLYVEKIGEVQQQQHDTAMRMDALISAAGSDEIDLHISQSVRGDGTDSVNRVDRSVSSYVEQVVDNDVYNVKRRRMNQ
jgi:hypothetical protein